MSTMGLLERLGLLSTPDKGSQPVDCKQQCHGSQMLGCVERRAQQSEQKTRDPEITREDCPKVPPIRTI
jgi:hypothetical protein